MTVTAPARSRRSWGLPATLRVAVALAAIVTIVLVGLAGLFASPASAQTLTRPGNAVGAFGAAGGQVVGAHQPVLAGQRRARAPSYDPAASGSCVAAETAPSASSIISRTAQDQSARGVDALKGYLSPAERAAFESNPEGGSRFLGQAVHRATDEALGQDFPGRFIYRTRGPDFVDTTTGEMVELTTPGQVASHMARPGYGGVSYSNYSLMPWIP